jgi:hypothetical protein
MLGLERLAPWPRPAIDAGLRRAAADLGHENVFNVSVLIDRGTVHVAYRALPQGASKPFHAFYAVANLACPGSWRIRSLTEHAASYAVAPTADPKLFALGEQIYVTFNTGYSPVQNEIYLMQVAPNLTPPQKCVLVAGRQAVEKNWAFYPGADGRLAAIYQLAPFTVLSLTSGEVTAGGDLTFEQVGDGTGPGVDGMTIGTGVLVDEDRMLLVAHEKVRLGPKRAYVGRLVEIRGAESKTPRVRVSPRRLIHSFRASLPPRQRHNPNLISATYFAGITPFEDGLLLGYGINDLAFSMAQVQEEQLWRN